MSAPADRLAQFLAALDQLPPFTGITLRGCVEGAEFAREGQLVVLEGVVSTSRDLDVATEGRALRRVFAILSRTGRDISPFSARRAEQEVVLLPGTVLMLERILDVAGFEVRLVTEVTPSGEPVRVGGPELERFAAATEQGVRARAADPVALVDSIPGKFSGDLR